MRVIVAGSRTISNYPAVQHAIEHSFPDLSLITEIVSGNNGYLKKGVLFGVDRLGEKWAEAHNIPIKRFPADWNFYGAQAGPLRNKQMARYAMGCMDHSKETEDYALPLQQGALVLVWDGASSGSGHMLRTAKRAGLKVFETILQNLHDDGCIPPKIW